MSDNKKNTNDVEALIIVLIAILAAFLAWPHVRSKFWYWTTFGVYYEILTLSHLHIDDFLYAIGIPHRLVSMLRLNHHQALMVFSGARADTIDTIGPAAAAYGGVQFFWILIPMAVSRFVQVQRHTFDSRFTTALDIESHLRESGIYFTANLPVIAENPLDDKLGRWDPSLDLSRWASLHRAIDPETDTFVETNARAALEAQLHTPLRGFSSDDIPLHMMAVWAIYIEVAGLCYDRDEDGNPGKKDDPLYDRAAFLANRLNKIFHDLSMSRRPKGVLASAWMPWGPARTPWGRYMDFASLIFDVGAMAREFSLLRPFSSLLSGISSGFNASAKSRRKRAGLLRRLWVPAGPPLLADMNAAIRADAEVMNRIHMAFGPKPSPGYKSVRDEFVALRDMPKFAKKRSEAEESRFHFLTGVNFAHQMIKRHAYVETALATYIPWAKMRGGVMPPSRMRWLKPLDRDFWYLINNVGRPGNTYMIEAVGAMSHWRREQALARPIEVPCIDGALATIKAAILKKINPKAEAGGAA